MKLRRLWLIRPRSMKNARLVFRVRTMNIIEAMFFLDKSLDALKTIHIVHLNLFTNQILNYEIICLNGVARFALVWWRISGGATEFGELQRTGSERRKIGGRYWIRFETANHQTVSRKKRWSLMNPHLQATRNQRWQKAWTRSESTQLIDRKHRAAMAQRCSRSREAWLAKSSLPENRKEQLLKSHQ